MRILHVHSGNLYGGVETYLATLARCRHLCPEMQPEFALCFDGRLTDELRESGATVQTLGEVRVRYPWTVTRARKRLQHLLRKNRYDAALCHAAWAQAIFGPVTHRTGTTNIFCLHDRAACRHWLERWARRARPNYAICNSRYTQNSLANLYPEVDSETVYLPVAPNLKPALTERSAIRSELWTPQNATVIIQVSRMEAWKGHSQLLEALAGMRETSDWVAWIVGGAQRSSEQEYVQFLKERARQLQIMDHIRFVGQRNDVTRLLAGADIFCQPNLEGEPFGISFIEALYAGLPVVTTNIGCALEIVDSSCGILVPPGDPVALREALATLITSRALRTALGEAGPSRASNISNPATQLARQYQVLREVVCGSGTPRITDPTKMAVSTESNFVQP